MLAFRAPARARLSIAMLLIFLVLLVTAMT
jgi:hypothetical protein